LISNNRREREREKERERERERERESYAVMNQDFMNQDCKDVLERKDIDDCLDQNYHLLDY
jgi:hypothetical protein